MASYTKNLNLIKPVDTDPFTVEHANSNMEKIDSAMLAQSKDTGIVLSDDVATAFGLEGNPQVKDALSLLSSAVNPLQYVWEKYSYSLNVNVATTLTARNISVAQYETSGDWFRVTYGDSYKIVGNEFLITNPTTVELHQGTWTNYLQTFNNKYISVTSSSWGSFCAKVVNSNMRQINNFAAIDCYSITWSWTQTLVGQVQSYAKNTYPQNDIQDGFYYKYIGKPQYIGTRIATGSYTGTGTYGSDNPNSLTFSFAPKFLIVCDVQSTNLSGNGQSYYFIYCAEMTKTRTYMDASGNAEYQNFTSANSGKTIQWYTSSNAGRTIYDHSQLNQSGRQYCYVAIG